MTVIANDSSFPCRATATQILPFEAVSLLFEMTEAGSRLEDFIFFNYFKLAPNSENLRAEWLEFKNYTIAQKLIEKYNIRKSFVKIEKFSNINIKRRSSRKIKLKKSEMFLFFLPTVKKNHGTKQ